LGFFWDRVSQTICPGWLRKVILLISASWVARITGVSHQCPPEYLIPNVVFYLNSHILCTFRVVYIA
jgi:hypothetical protein